MKAQTKGILWIIIPPTLLFTAIVAYSIVSFVMSSVAAGVSNGESVSMIANIIQVMLGLLGLIGVIGLPLGLALGIYYLTRPKETAVQPVVETTAEEKLEEPIDEENVQ